MNRRISLKAFSELLEKPFSYVVEMPEELALKFLEYKIINVTILIKEVRENGN